MNADWFHAIAYGVLLAAGLETAVVALRRFARGLRVGLSFDLWALVSGLTLALSLGGAPERLLKWGIALTALATALVLFLLFDAFVVRRPWAPHAGALMPKLVRDVVRALLLALVTLWLAHNVFQVEMTALVASSTVLSAVLGLALQDVLGQVFAGMAIQIERPFAIGDWLMVDGQLAKVVEMSWRSTRLRTNDGVHLFEPNNKMTSARLQNYGSGREAVAFQLEIGVDYTAPPAEVHRVLAAAVRDVPGVALQPPPEVFLTGFGDSAMTYRVRVWTHEVARFNPLRDHVNSRLWYALRREGMGIPFPIRTVQLHRADEEEAARREREVAAAQRLLADLALFDQLPAAALRRPAAAAPRLAYGDGERLVREQEQGDSLFVIERGRVVISKSGDPHGTGVIEIARMGAGDFFGEMSLLTGEPRSATVRADGPVDVLVLSKAALAPLIASDPEVAETLSAALAARRAEQAATLQGHQARRGEAAAVQASLLQRIRAFFGAG